MKNALSVDTAVFMWAWVSILLLSY